MARLWDKRLLDYKGWNFPDVSHNTPWLYLYGSSGSGKTNMALKIMSDLWEGWEFTNVIEFIEVLRAARGNSENINQYLRTMYEHPRMVIDDLGFEPVEVFNNYGTKYSPTEIIKNILFFRHKKLLRTIITSNLSPWPPIDAEPGETSKIEQLYNKKILRRILEVSTVYNMKGDWTSGRKADEPVTTLRHKGMTKATYPLAIEPEPVNKYKDLTPQQELAELEKMPAEVRDNIRAIAQRYTDLKRQVNKKK